MGGEESNSPDCGNFRARVSVFTTVEWGHGHTSHTCKPRAIFLILITDTHFSLHWTLWTHTYLHRQGSLVDAIWIPCDRLQYTLVGSWSSVCFSIISAALIMEIYMHAWAENYMAYIEH
jgi:hypothetical protein